MNMMSPRDVHIILTIILFVTLATGNTFHDPWTKLDNPQTCECGGMDGSKSCACCNDGGVMCGAKINRHKCYQYAITDKYKKGDSETRYKNVIETITKACSYATDDRYTNTTSGCICRVKSPDYDDDEKVCACCMNGGIQCEGNYNHQCVANTPGKGPDYAMCGEPTPANEAKSTTGAPTPARSTTSAPTPASGEVCWTELPHTKSSGGKQVGTRWFKLDTCKSQCLKDPACIAFDFDDEQSDSGKCSIHTKAADLTTTNTKSYYTSVQFRLDRSVGCKAGPTPADVACWTSLPHTSSPYGIKINGNDGSTLQSCESFCERLVECLAIDYNTGSTSHCTYHTRGVNLNPGSLRNQSTSTQYRINKRSKMCPGYKWHDPWTKLDSPQTCDCGGMDGSNSCACCNDGGTMCGSQKNRHKCYQYAINDKYTGDDSDAETRYKNVLTTVMKACSYATNDLYTNTTSGCICRVKSPDYDDDEKVCACCMNGGIQCEGNYNHKCVDNTPGKGPDYAMCGKLNSIKSKYRDSSTNEIDLAGSDKSAAYMLRLRRSHVL